MNARDKELEKSAVDAIVEIKRSFDKAAQPYIKILMDVRARNIEPIIITREEWEKKT